jgi:hypothetical protein
MTTFEYAANKIKKNGLNLMNPFLPEIRSSNPKMKSKSKVFGIKYVPHKVGEIIDIVDMRMSLMTGVRPAKSRLSYHWTEMQFFIDGDKWMSTHPVEVFSHIYAADKAHGDILIGGLGLGLISNMITTNDRYKSITCVEIEKDLVDLLESFFPEVEFVVDDISHYFDTCKKKFDFIYLDTWCGTGEMEFNNTVAPLRKKALLLLKKPNKKNLVCWMEEVMRGQSVQAILGGIAILLVPPTPIPESLMEHYKKWNLIVYDFFQKYPLESLKGVSKEKYVKLAQDFVDNWELA